MPGQTLELTKTPTPTFTPIATVRSTAGAEERPGVFIKKIFESDNGGTLPYQFRIPENYQVDRRYPLLVFLHGAGELGDDNSRQTINFPGNFLNAPNSRDYPFFIIAPQCPSKDTWVSFPNYPRNAQTTQNPTPATRLTIELIEKLLSEYNIDEHRVYVLGVSLGGEGTFDIVSRRPDLFAAAVPICGIVDAAKASSMKDVSLWIFHGEDDDINPVIYSRMIVQALNAEGVSPRYTEYKGAGHSIWNRVYDEPELPPWLFSQQKK
jgi:predicted peptidase